MSTIVAVKTKSGACIACDSKHLRSGEVVHGKPIPDSKFIKFDNCFIGSCGMTVVDSMLLQFIEKQKILAAANEWVFALQKPEDLLNFFVKFKKWYIEELCKEDWCNTFLILNKNGIFFIDKELCMVEYSGYHSVGSGSSYALGCLLSAYDEYDSFSDLATNAVRAAIHFDNYSGGPIFLEELK